MTHWGAAGFLLFDLTAVGAVGVSAGSRFMLPADPSSESSLPRLLIASSASSSSNSWFGSLFKAFMDRSRPEHCSFNAFPTNAARFGLKYGV